MLSELRQLLETGPSRRRADDVDVWFLDSGPIWRRFRHWKAIKALEIAVLSAVWRLPMPVYLLPGDDPPDSELAPFIQRKGSDWRIDTASSPEAFYQTEHTSTYGAWCLYASERPLTIGVPDVFRIPPDRLLAFMAEQHVSVIVAAFHDAAPWCVAIHDLDRGGDAR